MAQVQFSVATNGTGVATGITATQNITGSSWYDYKTNDWAFTNGVFGYSVTTYFATGVPKWAVEVQADIGGGIYGAIAAVTNIGSTASGFIPFAFGLQGTTAPNFIGIPRPKRFSFIGTSTGVGTTFGCVATVTLHNPD